MTRRTAILVSLLIGIALEVGVGLLSGRREAWDSPAFWSIGAPLALIAAAAVGYKTRGRDWVCTILVVPGQILAMATKTRDFGLLPLGLVLGALMSVPFLGAAFVGQAIRRRSSAR